MPRARTPEEAAERAMARRKNRQASGDKNRKKPRAARNYTIHYDELHPSMFEDWAVVWKHPGYSRPPAPQPNNGEHGAKRISPPLDWSTKRRFYTDLLASVAEHGIRNPVFAIQYPDGLYVRYGCSRVWAAKRLGVFVPVVIADYTGFWKGITPLETEADIRAKYVNQPALIELEPDYMRIDGCQ